MYLNVYCSNLQYPSGVATVLRQHRGAQYASSVLLQPITDAFVSKTDAFTTTRQIPVVTYWKEQRKDDLAKQERFLWNKNAATGGTR